jgi:DNA-binding MarR family transcriptional regulator
MATTTSIREIRAARRTPEALAARLRLADGAGFLVRVLGTRATALYEELTGQAEITPRQFGALLTLHQQGPLTLTQLAQEICVDRSTLGEMVRRMARNGLVRRRDNGEDRRSAVVSLNPKGETAVLRLVEGAAAVQAVLLAPIPPEQRQEFLRCLKLVAFAKKTS